MSRGYPSMTALLGLLAIAGYQNRDKIAEMLRGAQSNPADPAAPLEDGCPRGDTRKPWRDTWWSEHWRDVKRRAS